MVHNEHYRTLQAWLDAQGLSHLQAEALPGPHFDGADEDAGDHQHTCRLLSGYRSIANELVFGAADIIGAPAADILGAIDIRCIRDTTLKCFTDLASPSSAGPSVIRISHGVHMFAMNVSVLARSLLRETLTGRPSPISITEARELFSKQASYFVFHADNAALVFPFHKFDREMFEWASEATLQMMAFAIGHEIGHAILPMLPESDELLVTTKQHAQAFLSKVPDPFLGLPPDPDWQAHWTTEFVCDVLATVALFQCDRSGNHAFPAHPSIAGTNLPHRFLGVEGLLSYLEAIYLHTTFIGKDIEALTTLYASTHPLPNLRRTFLRGFAELIDPRLPELAGKLTLEVKRLGGYGV